MEALPSLVLNSIMFNVTTAHLLCARLCTKLWTYSDEQNRYGLCLLETAVQGAGRKYTRKLCRKHVTTDHYAAAKERTESMRGRRRESSFISPERSLKRWHLRNSGERW